MNYGDEEVVDNADYEKDVDEENDELDDRDDDKL
jgi:hypothetical protein